MTAIATAVAGVLATLGQVAAAQRASILGAIEQFGRTGTVTPVPADGSAPLADAVATLATADAPVAPRSGAVDLDTLRASAIHAVALALYDAVDTQRQLNMLAQVAVARMTALSLTDPRNT